MMDEIREELPAEYVIRCLENNKVVVFSKTWCPFCALTKDLFKRFRVNFKSSELDVRADGSKILEYLHEKTGQKTVPSIFINKTHIGGYSDLNKIAMAGILPDVLDGDVRTFEYDLIIIGGGSGGLAAAKTAAKLSQKVALFDFVKPTPLGTKWGLGGTCVNVGCIPKKLMHRGSLIHLDMIDAPYFGWNVPESTEEHDWEKLVENVQNYIKSLNYSYRKQMKELKVDYFNMYATFQDKHTITAKNSVGEIKTFTAMCFIIAIGSRPIYLDVPGANELCISSDDLFSLPKRPSKVLIVGASYIALECAGFLRGLGCDVTVMVRSVLLRGFDRGMAERIQEFMTEYGVKFVQPCVPIGFERDQSGDGALIVVRGLMKSGETFEETVSTVLMAVGRRPTTSELNLEKIGVQINRVNSKICVDPWERCAVTNIFAIGDVVDGGIELTPVAVQAGKWLASRLFSHKFTKLMEYTNVPTTVFTPLEYSCVGLTEEAANLKFKGEIEVFHNLFTPLEFTISKRFGMNHCYAKMICAKRDEDKVMKVVGIHMIGPQAGEIVQGFAIALKLGATKDDFDDLFGTHPTTAEIFASLTITKSSGQKLKIDGC